MALRRRTAGGDGASRSRSAGDGRGGARRRLSPRAGPPRLVGPAGCEQRPPSAWPAGPSQEAGYDCHSVGVVDRGAPRSTGAGSPPTRPRPSRLAWPRFPVGAPYARFSYIRAGKSWTNPREDFSKEGRGEKPETSSGYDPHFQRRRGQGLAAEPSPGRRLSSDTRWPGWPSDSWFSPPLREGGSEPARPPG